VGRVRVAGLLHLGAAPEAGRYGLCAAVGDTAFGATPPPVACVCLHTLFLRATEAGHAFLTLSNCCFLCLLLPATPGRPAVPRAGELPEHCLAPVRVAALPFRTACLVRACPATALCLERTCTVTPEHYDAAPGLPQFTIPCFHTLPPTVPPAGMTQRLRACGFRCRFCLPGRICLYAVLPGGRRFLQPAGRAPGTLASANAWCDMRHSGLLLQDRTALYTGTPS